MLQVINRKPKTALDLARSWSDANVRENYRHHAVGAHLAGQRSAKTRMRATLQALHEDTPCPNNRRGIRLAASALGIKLKENNDE